MTMLDNGSAPTEEDEKPRTLFVGNIPPTTRRAELESLFAEIGPLKRCHLQYPRNRQSEEPLVAYITYGVTEDATEAVTKFSNYKLENKKLNIKLIKSRAEHRREPRVGRPTQTIDVEREYEASSKQTVRPRPKRNNEKKARLIVRNISFQTNEELLRKHFASCGEVVDVNILKKPNGKLVGCAFVQYKNVHEGFRAMKVLNTKEFLGRPIVIDWAVAKEKYTGNANHTPVKAEPGEEEDVEDKKVKIEQEDNSAGDDDVQSDDDEDDDDIEELDEKPDLKPRIPVKSNDADEGKTVFIRNLSFDVTEEELREFFQKFGMLVYALICKDSLTEHPKGTGFVKFKDAEAATACLSRFEEDSSAFTLNDRQIFVTMALSKGKLEERINVDKVKPKKDNRRLYLAREGFIRPGSAAAQDVSITDMNKRASIHKTKNQMLKDLNTFVSDTRLCAHNLPSNLNDEKLRKLFLDHGGPNAKITEARVMRDLKTLNRESKGFGFVTFTIHENALQALRSLNNNPGVFTPKKRPIVEFALENRKAILAKESRLVKSQEKLEKLKTQNETDVIENEDEKPSKRQRRKLKKQLETNDEEANQEEEPAAKKKKLRHKRKDTEEDGQTPIEFAGLTGKHGITKSPSLKVKGKITRKSLKTKGNKLPRRNKEPKVVRKSRDETDYVDKMVAKHQKKLKSAAGVKQKWYN